MIGKAKIQGTKRHIDMQTESHTDDIQIDSLRWATKQSLHAIRVEKKDRLPYTYRHAIERKMKKNGANK